LWAGWQPETVPTTLQWTTIDGKRVRLSDLRTAKAVVFITLSTRCPAVPRYVPRLNALYETYQQRGVVFYGIYPEADETLDGVRAHAQQLGLKFPVVHQGAVALARALRATHVPPSVCAKP
jgi:glutathione peroxidase-family protein